VTELAKSSPHAAATIPVRSSLDRNVERWLVHVPSSSIHSCPRPRPRHSSRAQCRRSSAQICSSWLLIRSWTTNPRFANAHAHPPSSAVARDTTFFTPYISARSNMPPHSRIFSTRIRRSADALHRSRRVVLRRTDTRGSLRWANKVVRATPTLPLPRDTRHSLR
jgi:hypothetical protein